MPSDDLKNCRTQFLFDESRGWKFDFAWKDQKVAVEIEGGIFQKGKNGQPTGHRSITGVLRDIEKYNAAAIAGWCVIRVHSGLLDGEPVQTIKMVVEALRSRQ